jgi:hypothetical protein
MLQPTVSDAATIIQFLFTGITICVALLNAFFFFVLRNIKKNIDDLWSKINENRRDSQADHDDITKIKAKIEL